MSYGFSQKFSVNKEGIQAALEAQKVDWANTIDLAGRYHFEFEILSSAGQVVARSDKKFDSFSAAYGTANHLISDNVISELDRNFRYDNNNAGRLQANVVMVFELEGLDGLE